MVVNKKDEVYNNFKKELAKYHRRGYKLNFPLWQENYDEEAGEHICYVEVAFFKKRKPPEGM